MRPYDHLSMTQAEIDAARRRRPSQRRVSSIFPEVNGKRRIDVRPWNVRTGDIIECVDTITMPYSSFLVEVNNPPERARTYFARESRWAIPVQKVRVTSNALSLWEPETLSYYGDDRVQVFRK